MCSALPHLCSKVTGLFSAHQVLRMQPQHGTILIHLAVGDDNGGGNSKWYYGAREGKRRRLNFVSSTLSVRAPMNSASERGPAVRCERSATCHKAIVFSSNGDPYDTSERYGNHDVFFAAGDQAIGRFDRCHISQGDKPDCHTLGLVLCANEGDCPQEHGRRNWPRLRALAECVRF